ncbi:MAG: hypothetical protein AB9869_18830 [Verrucomicrobiia bacterium]
MQTVNRLLQILTWVSRFFAWCFAVGTLTLLGVFWALLVFVPRTDRHTTMMSNGLTDAWGLTYVGRPGVVLGLAELILVFSALWASRTRHLACRSMGHLVLVLWAGLWMANAFFVFADGTFGLIYVTPFFFVCTCVRAVLDLATPSTPPLAQKPA